MKRVEGIYDDGDQLLMLASITKHNPMMGVIFLLGVVSGLRVSDILALKVKELDRDFLAYESKTGKYKEVRLGHHWEMLAVYLDGMNPEDRAFPTTRQTAHKYFKMAAKDLDIPSIGTHSMRKTYAYNVFRSSGCLKTTQKSLNHKYMSVTISYLVGGFIWAVKMAHKHTVPKRVAPCYEEVV